MIQKLDVRSVPLTVMVVSGQPHEDSSAMRELLRPVLSEYASVGMLGKWTVEDVAVQWNAEGDRIIDADDIFWFFYLPDDIEVAFHTMLKFTRALPQRMLFVASWGGMTPDPRRPATVYFSALGVMTPGMAAQTLSESVYAELEIQEAKTALADEKAAHHATRRILDQEQLRAQTLPRVSNIGQHDPDYVDETSWLRRILPESCQGLLLKAVPRLLSVVSIGLLTISVLVLLLIRIGNGGSIVPLIAKGFSSIVR